MQCFQATQKGGLSNTVCRLDYNSGQSIDDIQRFREFINSSPTVKSIVEKVIFSLKMFKKNSFFLLVQPPFKFGLVANRTAFIDCFNTPNANCVKYVCSAFGPLSTESPIRISLTGTLLLQNICIDARFLILIIRLLE